MLSSVVLSVALAGDASNSIGVDVGVSPGCFGLCLAYDRTINERVGVGLTLSPWVIMNAAALQLPVTVANPGSLTVFLEPGVGTWISPLSREVFVGGQLSLGVRRGLGESGFFSVQAGAWAGYDLEDVVPMPDVRVGVGRSF